MERVIPEKQSPGRKEGGSLGRAFQTEELEERRQRFEGVWVFKKQLPKLVGKGERKGRWGGDGR